MSVPVGKNFKDSKKGEKLGGVQAVVDMLKEMDEPSREKIIANVSARDARLASELRERILSFNDLCRMSAADMQLLLKSVRSELLALAMKTASEEMKKAVKGSLSTRAQKILEDDVQMLGPRRASDVSAAQHKIVDLARELMAQGKIKL